MLAPLSAFCRDERMELCVGARRLSAGESVNARYGGEAEEGGEDV